MFAVKKSVVKELLADSEWRSKLDCAKTWREAGIVVAEFARSRGYRVKVVDGIEQNQSES